MSVLWFKRFWGGLNIALPTRYFSSKQEKAVAKEVKGETVANSGATRFSKGDIRTDKFLIEAKTVTREQKTFTLKKEWFIKNKEEAFAMRKPYNALVFDFGDGERYYIIDEKTFLQVQNLLEGEDIND